VKIPNLAIHLTTERTKFEPNYESNLRPIFSSSIYDAFSEAEKSDKQEKKEKVEEKKEILQNSIKNKHYSGLLDLIQSETEIDINNIIDMDLVFVDTQPATFLGLHNEFISSPRLDNLFSSFTALNSIISEEASGNESSFLNMICLFDHEECGSESA